MINYYHHVHSIKCITFTQCYSALEKHVDCDDYVPLHFNLSCISLGLGFEQTENDKIWHW